jgi:hypothetical protein
MPRLICATCGRSLYADAPLESLSLDERRCPRCGSALRTDLRQGERRLQRRREIGTRPMEYDGEERRAVERRTVQRRQPGGSPGSSQSRGGWTG